MKNYMIIIFLTGLSQCCSIQSHSTYSINQNLETELQGFVFIDIAKIYFHKGKITIVRDGNDTVLYAENKNIYIDGISYETIRDEHLYRQLIDVEAFYPEYGLFVLKCYGMSNEFYKVLINGSISLIKKEENKDYVEFKDLHNYLMGTIPVPTQHNPLRVSPDENSAVLEDFDKWIFIPIEIRGDWLKVKDSKDCYQGEVPSSIEITGWVRWRKKGELILKVAYRC